MFLRPPEPLRSGMMLLGCGSSGGGVVAPSAPGTPTGFAATPGDQEIVLTWDAQPEAGAFEIHYGTTDVIGAASVLTTNATGTGFTFDSTDSIQVGEKYYFWISAINVEGSSAFSSSVTARSYVTVAGGGGSASLTTPTGSWTFGTLFFGRSPDPIPNSTTVVYSVALYTMFDGDWYNESEELANETAISGAFTFLNNSGVSVTFWNGEP